MKALMLAAVALVATFGGEQVKSHRGGVGARRRHVVVERHAAPPAIVKRRVQYGTTLSASTPRSASVVRADACWECVQPTPGAWNWAHDDALARELGRRWQPILDYAPDWATVGHWVAPPHPYVPPPGTPPPVSIIHKPPVNIAAFARFAAAFAKRYHPRVIEVWNEPDVYVYWNPPDGYVYGRLLAAAYRAIKAVAPHTIVLGGGLDEGNASWFIPQVARTLHGVVPDGWSVHPYASGIRGLEGELTMDHDELARYHLWAPFYVTEWGCWSLQKCPPGAVFRRETTPVVARDPDVVQADWFGNLPS